MIGLDHKLIGVYTPVYLGNCLYQFVNTGEFGSIDPTDYMSNLQSTKLMDLLPCVKTGLVLRSSLTLLTYIYLKNNHLQEKENRQYSHFDDFMNEIFVNMEAEFYCDYHGKMLMSEAIERQIIQHPLSTQEVIRLKRPEFNQTNTLIEIKGNVYKKAFPNYYVSLLMCHNYYSKTDLLRLNKIEILEAMNNESIQKQMIIEYNIISETFEKWRDFK